jgi:hypothetical protein
MGAFLVLSVKQRLFAKLVGSGMSKRESYAKAYNSQGNPNTQATNGHRLSRKPVIATAIAEYEAQLLVDLRAEKINVLMNLRTLALSPDVSDKVRLEASVALLEYCERREQAERLSDCQ